MDIELGSYMWTWALFLGNSVWHPFLIMHFHHKPQVGSTSWDRCEDSVGVGCVRWSSFWRCSMKSTTLFFLLWDTSWSRLNTSEISVPLKKVALIFFSLSFLVGHEAKGTFSNQWFLRFVECRIRIFNYSHYIPTEVPCVEEWLFLQLHR